MAELAPPIRMRVAEVDWDPDYYLKKGVMTQTKVGKLRSALCDRIALIGSIREGAAYYHEKGTKRWWKWSGTNVFAPRGPSMRLGIR